MQLCICLLLSVLSYRTPTKVCLLCRCTPMDLDSQRSALLPTHLKQLIPFSFLFALRGTMKALLLLRTLLFTFSCLLEVHDGTTGGSSQCCICHVYLLCGHEDSRRVNQSLHVTKAAHIGNLLQRLLRQVQVVVRLDVCALLRLSTLLQPVQAHHIALLLHMCRELVVLLSCDEVRHILCPILIHLHARTDVRHSHSIKVWVIGCLTFDNRHQSCMTRDKLAAFQTAALRMTKTDTEIKQPLPATRHA